MGFVLWKPRAWLRTCNEYRKMRLKLDIAELRPGMYVSELDRPWTETPYLFQGIALETYSQIEELGQYCDYVFVDQKLPPSAAAQRRAEIDLFKHTAHQALMAPQAGTVAAFEQELREMRGQMPDLIAVIEDCWEDQRNGRPLRSRALQATAERVIASVFRNPDALLYLALLVQKSPTTVRHSLRTAILATSLGRALGISAAAMLPLTLGALLHDIGKAQLPEALLAKTTAPTPAEAVVLASHVERGGRLLAQAPDLPPEVVQIALLHHERLDDSGYPRHIPQRPGSLPVVVGLADEYDKLCSGGFGLQPVAPHMALLHLYSVRGKAFDATLVEALTQCIGIYPVGSLVELNTGHVGVVTALNRDRYLRPRILLVRDEQRQPYARPRAVDLARQARDEKAQPWEIKTILAPGTYGVEPADALATRLTAI